MLPEAAGLPAASHTHPLAVDRSIASTKHKALVRLQPAHLKYPHLGAIWTDVGHVVRYSACRVETNPSARVAQSPNEPLYHTSFQLTFDASRRRHVCCLVGLRFRRRLQYHPGGSPCCATICIPYVCKIMLAAPASMPHFPLASSQAPP